MANATHHLGIDIGKVLMAPIAGGRADTTFLSGSLEDAMRTPPTPGAFDAIAQLTASFGRRRVCLISKASPGVQNKTWHWLRHWDVYERTGLAPSRVWFCLERKDKAEHCARLGVTHFIDDRVDVLAHLRSVVPNLFLFGEQKGPPPTWVHPVLDWEAVLDAVLPPK